MRERRDLLSRDYAMHETRRCALLAEWEEVKAEEFRAIDAAATRVSRELRDRVSVKVHNGGDLQPLEHLGMGIPRKIIRDMRQHNRTDPELIAEPERFTLRLLRTPPTQNIA